MHLRQLIWRSYIQFIWSAWKDLQSLYVDKICHGIAWVRTARLRKLIFISKLISPLSSILLCTFGLVYDFVFIIWGGGGYNPFHFNEILFVLVLPISYILRYHNLYLSLNFVIFASQGCMICPNYMVIFTLN